MQLVFTLLLIADLAKSALLQLTYNSQIERPVHENALT